MAFERFLHAGRGNRPKISIRSNGQIGFNMAAIERFQLRKQKYAVLFYDKLERLIGILPTGKKEDEGAVKMQVRPTNASISGKSFLDYYEIEYEKTRKFSAVMRPEDGMIIVDLGESEK